MSDLRVSPRLTIPGDTITISHSRSSGPGGQNVNKVNSRVTLRWSPSKCVSFPDQWRQRFLSRHKNRINADGELVLHSDQYRDQPRNIADARQRLITMLLDCQAPPKIRKKSRPTRGSQERRLRSKRENSQKKQQRRGKIPED